jgi:hypothetical protein
LLGHIGIIAVPIAPGPSDRTVIADPNRLEQRILATRVMLRASRAMDAVDSHCTASNDHVGEPKKVAWILPHAIHKTRALLGHL